LLNKRSHLQLEPGIDTMSMASLLRLEYQSCSLTQYFIGLFALGLLLRATGLLRFQLSYSFSLLFVVPDGSIKLLIASSISLGLTVGRTQGLGKLLYVAYKA
jgi:hypothetical protein